MLTKIKFALDNQTKWATENTKERYDTALKELYDEADSMERKNRAVNVAMNQMISSIETSDPASLLQSVKKAQDNLKAALRTAIDDK